MQFLLHRCSRLTHKNVPVNSASCARIYAGMRSRCVLGQLDITPFALVHQPTKDERWAAYGTRIFKQRDKEDTSLL